MYKINQQPSPSSRLVLKQLASDLQFMLSAMTLGVGGCLEFRQLLRICISMHLSMVSLLFQNGDTKYHVLVSQTGRINRLDVFYQLDFIDFIW